jgi:serine/threonine-protein kinase
MELLLGEPLAARLRTQGRLRPAEILPIATQVCEAVVAIHAAGVVHRDLKPANIYLTDGDSGTVRAKILDFGIARVEWEEMRITNMGAPMGTPGYMSPEQESGGEVDVRSDVFAIGAVMYECLMGEPPPVLAEDMWKMGQPASVRLGLRLPPLRDPRLRDSTPDSGVHPASHRAPAAASTVSEPVKVPPDWRALIERALARKASERFQDARSLLVAVRALTVDESEAQRASST